MKKCNRCGETKPLGDFYAGMLHVCKVCHNARTMARHRAKALAEAPERARKQALRDAERQKALALAPEKKRQYQRAWEARNWDKKLAYMRKANTGASAELQKALWDFQNGNCACCGVALADYTLGKRCPSAKPVPCLDHDHTTGKPRGWLCRTCNAAEGLIRKRGPAVQAYIAAPPAQLLDFDLA